MRGSYRKLAIVAGIAVLAIAVAPASAGKRKTVRFKNGVSIELKNTPGQDKVSGAVTSFKAACVRARRVQIVEALGEQTNPVLAVVTKTDGTYDAQIPGGLLAGHSYLAFLPQKTIFKTKKKKGVCSSAQSTPVPVTEP
jgi:hypothetical protein